MKPHTIALQITCAILGAGFMLAGVAVHSYVGGFLIGALMFFAAALLGADPTTNTNSHARRIFQTLAGISAIPFVVASVIASVELSQAGQWAALLGTVLRLFVFVLAAVAITLSEHPYIQRQLKKLGFFTPNS